MPVLGNDAGRLSSSRPAIAPPPWLGVAGV